MNAIAVTPSTDAVRELYSARRRRARRRGLVLLGLGALIAVLLIASLSWGETFYTPARVWAVICGEKVPGASFTVGQLRLPRTILGLCAGLAFGSAGITFQTMLRNQLASPDIIGINAGAAAAGVIGIVALGLSQTAVSGMALAGALGTAAATWLLSHRSGFSGTRLVLVGIGMASLLGSVTTYVLSKASAWDLQVASRWLTGSLNGAGWGQVWPLVITCLLMLPSLWGLGRLMSVLLLGDDSAIGLGVRVDLVRLAATGCAVTLVAVATASCGPIAFVAFMSGPIALRMLGPNSSPMVGAGLVGAVLVLGSDFIGQWLVGTRYPVGVITGILGAPHLIHLLIRSNRSGVSL